MSDKLKILSAIDTSIIHHSYIGMQLMLTILLVYICMHGIIQTTYFLSIFKYWLMTYGRYFNIYIAYDTLNIWRITVIPFMQDFSFCKLQINSDYATFAHIIVCTWNCFKRMISKTFYHTKLWKYLSVDICPCTNLVIDVRVKGKLVEYEVIKVCSVRLTYFPASYVAVWLCASFHRLNKRQ